MRFIWCLLLSVMFVTQSANAQSVPVYNATSLGSSSERVSVYNSSNAGGAKPLSITGLLRGKSQNSGYSRNSANTYNLGSKQPRRQSLLSLTPAQVRARQEKSKQNAQKRAEETKKQRAKLQKEQTFSDRSERFKSRFQTSTDNVETSNAVVPQEKKKRTIFLKNNKSSIPKPVFNRTY